MKRPISLSVFFPAYNEEVNIASSVRQAETALKALTDTYEIIIVNDGSSDRTGLIAQELAAKNRRVRVIHHHLNQGYGAAVLSGLRSARYDYVFFTDADLQFDLAELAKLVQHIPEYQVVIGYRARRRDHLMRLANAKGWNILNRLLFGLRVRDIDCAFKLFRRDLVANLPLKSRGAMLSAELLIRLQRQGVTFKEVPVTHLPRRTGSPTGAKPRVIARAFAELLQTYRGELGNVTQHQLVKFALVGGANTLLDLIAYFVLTRSSDFFAHHLIAAKVLSFGMGTVSSFLLNRAWTFRRDTPLRLGEIMRFYATVGTALVINALGLFVFLRLFDFRDVPAVLLATVLTFIWNFSFSKFWVFAKRERKFLAITIPPLDWLLLLAIIAATVVNTLLWLRIDTYPPHWDMANHLRNSLIYVDDFRAILESTGPRDLAAKAYEFFIGRETYYPPLVYWTSVPFILVLGRTFQAAVLSQTVFLVIFVFVIYSLGRRLWNRATGLMAALVAVTFPFVAGQFHEFQLDLPLTVLAALALWGLIQTARWRRSGWSFIFGLLVGLGMLTKWPLPAFLLGPVIYELIGRGREIRKLEQASRRRAWLQLAGNLGLAGLGLLIVAGPWYFTHSGVLWGNLLVNWQTGTGEGDPSPLSFASLRLYPDVLVQAQIRLLLLVPLLIGFFVTLARRENRQRNGLLLAFLLSGYLVMTLYNNKDYRFIEPVLASVAILAVFWISLLGPPWRALAASYIILVALFQFLSVSWGERLFPLLPPRVVTYLPDIEGGRYRLMIWEFTGYGSGPPRPVHWPQEDLLNIIITDAAAQPPSRPRLHLALYYKDNADFNRENFQYASLKNELPIRVLDGPPATFQCRDADYLIATDREGVAADVAANFPFYDSYPSQAKDRRKPKPLCQLVPLYEGLLPNGDGVHLWRIVN